jgi:DNA polymerase I-like protein with 3'-5' exonuclease and polymerase domains
MTASRLLTPRRGVSHSLKAVLERYINVSLPKEHGASDWGAMFLTEEQVAYARDDVRFSHRLQQAQELDLDRADLRAVFDLEIALIPIVVAMEEHGFAVDRTKLEAMQMAAAETTVSTTKQLREAFGLVDLNPESPSQLLEAFRSAGTELADTAEPTLVALEDPRAEIVLQFRTAAKLQSSIKGLHKAVQTDGRIHARFSPTGSLAGRFSSSGPNLQNITRGPLRSAFVAGGSDRVLIVADYSQIELRIGAYFAADAVMLEAFRRKEDLHRATAAAVLAKPLDEITKEDRQLAKAVNFGFLYGQGAAGFRTYARTEYGIVLSSDQAVELREKFFARYQGLREWHSQAWEKAENGIAENCTILGRRLLAQGDKSWDRFQVHTNYVIQGSAADVLKHAMVKAVSVLPVNVGLIATVHDELIFDCQVAEAQHYKTVIRLVMEDAFKEFFPSLAIEVEAKVCDNWADK